MVSRFLMGTLAIPCIPFSLSDAPNLAAHGFNESLIS